MVDTIKKREHLLSSLVLDSERRAPAEKLLILPPPPKKKVTPEVTELLEYLAEPVG